MLGSQEERSAPPLTGSHLFVIHITLQWKTSKWRGMCLRAFPTRFNRRNQGM